MCNYQREMPETKHTAVNQSVKFEIATCPLIPKSD